MMKREKEEIQQRNMLDAAAQANAAPIPDLDSQLHQLGLPVGVRILELVFYREKGSANACSNAKREIKILQMLYLVQNKVWPALFGKAADGLELSVNDPNEYRILDKSPLTNKFVSSQEPGSNCSSFIAGIVEGIFCSCKMDCKVTAYYDKDSQATLFLVKFTQETMDRNEAL